MPMATIDMQDLNSTRMNSIFHNCSINNLVINQSHGIRQQELSYGRLVQLEQNLIDKTIEVIGLDVILVI